MNRRTFALRGGALVGSIVSLSGCTDSTLQEAKSQPPPVAERFDEGLLGGPVTTRYDVAAEGIERADGADAGTTKAFEEYLKAQDIAVESVEEKEEHGTPVLSVEYAPAGPSEEGLMRSLGVVAGGYAALVDAGLDAEKLKASLLDPDGRVYGEYEIPTDYAERYNAGEITAKEYGRLASKKITSR